MSNYKEGYTSKAICYDTCKSLQSVTLRYKSWKDKGTILVAVCNNCDSIVAIPHKSLFKDQ